MFIKRDDDQIRRNGELALHDVIATVDSEPSLKFPLVEESINMAPKTKDEEMERYVEMEIEARKLHENINFDNAIDELNNSAECIFWKYDKEVEPLELTLLNGVISFKSLDVISKDSLNSLASKFDACLFDEFGNKVESSIKKKKSIFSFLGF